MCPEAAIEIDVLVDSRSEQHPGTVTPDEITGRPPATTPSGEENEQDAAVTALGADRKVG
jgi:hypothetical protein